jgi:hypothetical protein
MIFRLIDSLIKIISPSPRRAKHIADAVLASHPVRRARRNDEARDSCAIINPHV